MRDSIATDDLIALICKAASERYVEDRLRPGIQIAHLPQGPEYPVCVATPAQAAGAAALGLSAGDMLPVTRDPARWYVALHRYPVGSISGSRVIAYKATDEDLDVAIRKLALQLLPIEHQINLRNAMKGVSA